MPSDDKPEPSSEAVKDSSPQETESEGRALEMAAKPAADEPKKDSLAPAADAAHGHVHDAAHDHGHGPAVAHGAPDAAHDHGLAHTTPVWFLFAVLGALLVLTIATVSVTAIDLGSQGNLIVAMAIATVKAGLVVTFFMHLFWDKKFNLVLFLTSVLFLILFLSMATTDRSEYQHLMDEYRASHLPTK
jgi:cytochrome c oxidase subunit 4